MLASAAVARSGNQNAAGYVHGAIWYWIGARHNIITWKSIKNAGILHPQFFHAVGHGFIIYFTKPHMSSCDMHPQPTKLLSVKQAHAACIQAPSDALTLAC